MNDCSCHIEEEVVNAGHVEDYQLVLCPLHEAAPELLRACREGLLTLKMALAFLSRATGGNLVNPSPTVKYMEQAIAKAERKERVRE